MYGLVNKVVVFLGLLIGVSASHCHNGNPTYDKAVFVEELYFETEDLTEAAKLRYKNGTQQKKTLNGIDFYLVYVDDNKDGIFNTPGTDLMTICFTTLDTLKWRFLDTVRTENIFKIDGHYISVTDSNIIEVEEPENFNKYNTFFNNFDAISYLTFDQELVNITFDKGRYTYIYVWSPKCSPCLANLALFQEFFNQRQDCNVDFYALIGEHFTEGWELIQKEGYDLKGGYASEAFMDYTNRAYFPQGYLIDPHGKLISTTRDIGAFRTAGIKCY